MNVDEHKQFWLNCFKWAARKTETAKNTRGKQEAIALYNIAFMMLYVQFDYTPAQLIRVAFGMSTTACQNLLLTPCCD